MYCCVFVLLYCCFFFFKQKTAYEMRISDWSSDVCSSDLTRTGRDGGGWPGRRSGALRWRSCSTRPGSSRSPPATSRTAGRSVSRTTSASARPSSAWPTRSEEHTSELQSLMRISYAVFCLKKKKKHTHEKHTRQH